MPPSSTSSTKLIQPVARSAHTIRAGDICGVLCHRTLNGHEEYLVIWRTEDPVVPRPPQAPLSWHRIPELWDALHHVQTYLQDLPRSNQSLTPQALTALTSGSRKRKAGDIDPEPASLNGLLTPVESTSDRSRSRSHSPSYSGVDRPKVDNDLNSKDDAETCLPSNEPRVYNAILQKKAGHITVKRMPKHETTSTSDLPTSQMLKTASRTPFIQAEEAIRLKFLEMLQPVKGVFLENNVDRSTPSLDFTFIKEYVLREGVEAADPDFLEGCMKCKPDMGGHCGCEYTAICGCLEYAGVDEERLKRKDPQIYNQYKTALDSGQRVNTEGLPKRFPYSKPTPGHPERPQRLVHHYLEQRHPIYECNDKCNCGRICKSRLVQKGRKVGLTIFKTEERGWGVYCNEDLIRGEFIDTYLGEVITSQEATKRESREGHLKLSYLYSLDKFVGDPDPQDPSQVLKDEDCHVVDGQHMGTPTRFINHSCEPNCRQYTVSYNKYDIRVYQLAFFAYEDIPKGTELTFDYMDEDEVEEDVAIANRLKAEANPANKDIIRCSCGARKCRGYLWKQEDEDDEEEDAG